MQRQLHCEVATLYYLFCFGLWVSLKVMPTGRHKNKFFLGKMVIIPCRHQLKGQPGIESSVKNGKKSSSPIKRVNNLGQQPIWSTSTKTNRQSKKSVKFLFTVLWTCYTNRGYMSTFHSQYYNHYSKHTTTSTSNNFHLATLKSRSSSNHCHLCRVILFKLAQNIVSFFNFDRKNILSLNTPQTSFPEN